MSLIRIFTSSLSSKYYTLPCSISFRLSLSPSDPAKGSIVVKGEQNQISSSLLSF